MIISAALALSLVSRCGAVFFHAPATPAEQARWQEAQRYLSSIGADEGQIKILNDQLEETRMRIDSNVAQTKLTEQIDAINKDLVVIRNKAIHAVIDAYGIRPDKVSAPLVVATHFQGMQATWTPVYTDIEYQWFTDSSGKSWGAAPLSGDSVTRANGQIEIGAGVFKSPAFLAAAIIHETVHFDQVTTHGRADRKGMLVVIMEREAYDLTVSNSTVQTLGLTEDERNDIEAREKAAMSDPKDYVKPEQEMLGIVGDPVPIPDLESLKVQGDVNFSEWQKQTKSIGEEIAQRNAEQEQSDELTRQKIAEGAAKMDARIAADEEQSRQKALEQAQIDHQKQLAEIQSDQDSLVAACKLMASFAQVACSNSKSIKLSMLQDFDHAKERAKSIDEAYCSINSSVNPYLYTTSSCAEALLHAVLGNPDIFELPNENSVKTAIAWAKEYKKRFAPERPGLNSNGEPSVAGNYSHSGRSSSNQTHDGPAQHQLRNGPNFDGN